MSGRESRVLIDLDRYVKTVLHLLLSDILFELIDALVFRAESLRLNYGTKILCLEHEIT